MLVHGKLQQFPVLLRESLGRVHLRHVLQDLRGLPWGVRDLNPKLPPPLGGIGPVGPEGLALVPQPVHVGQGPEETAVVPETAAGLVEGLLEAPVEPDIEDGVSHGGAGAAE